MLMASRYPDLNFIQLSRNEIETVRQKTERKQKDVWRRDPQTTLLKF